MSAFEVTATDAKAASLERTNSSLRARVAKLDSGERIQELASHDDLTGALNRRAFMQLLADERARTHRTGHPFCVALLDRFPRGYRHLGYLLHDGVFYAPGQRARLRRAFDFYGYRVV